MAETSGRAADNRRAASASYFWPQILSAVQMEMDRSSDAVADRTGLRNNVGANFNALKMTVWDQSIGG